MLRERGGWVRRMLSLGPQKLGLYLKFRAERRCHHVHFQALSAISSGTISDPAVKRTTPNHLVTHVTAILFLFGRCVHPKVVLFIGWFGLQETFKDHLVQCPAMGRSVFQ